jgi:hypothetical protein
VFNGNSRGSQRAPHAIVTTLVGLYTYHGCRVLFAESSLDGSGPGTDKPLHNMQQPHLARASTTMPLSQTAECSHPHNIRHCSMSFIFTLQNMATPTATNINTTSDARYDQPYQTLATQTRAVSLRQRMPTMTSGALCLVRTSRKRQSSPLPPKLSSKLPVIPYHSGELLSATLKILLVASPCQWP